MAKKLQKGLIALALLLIPTGTAAQSVALPVEEQFFHGEVVRIVSEQRDDFGAVGKNSLVQTIMVKFLDGPREGEEETIEYGVLNEEHKLYAGQRVVLVSANEQTYIFDRDRKFPLALILVCFVILAVVFAGWRGITSLAGLGISVAVLTLYVVPQVMAGKSPVMISLIGAGVIALVSLYLAHGFNRRTSVAVISTLVTILVAIGLAQLFVGWADLSGGGSEEAHYLQTSPLGFINIKGLLLGGIIIGALGVLDDITTSQAAAVQEIWRANPALSRRELFKRGARVGREHITSLINTLALAYVGASFPALLLFTIYQRPWWVVVNTETIAEEIIRTLVGSVALMVAVPITTALAAYWLPQQSSTKDIRESTHHVH